MTPSVEILKVGYSILNEEAKFMKANCTCTLVRDNNKIMLVDTLTAWDGIFLLKALEERGLQADDITHVVGTHGHSDHIGNLNLFTKALHIVGQSISHQDEYYLHSFEENDAYVISENIKIIATPGHTLSDVSVIVNGTLLGTVAIVGDLFEREDDIRNPDLWHKVAGSEDPDLQFKYRTMILDLADYVVPGHGPGFTVTNELKESHKKPEK
ncbi:metallo-beta-lactamase domain-containing protein 1 [Parasteatoda tepidariorum]|nr:metallo-beta-lactamase domain-containing protein 1 [Parasteatoda tepidariorum]